MFGGFPVLLGRIGGKRRISLPFQSQAGATCSPRRFWPYVAR